ncbi:MAG: phosphoglucomutase (alpha-D-glucose-1,6-bisphosphate-dependent) [Xanthomonadaceae bacterium]|nr:phosphoglucomutase (alpha-D-glucose-1,6-bisphosphate-dependent) [Xanthomonadaceae bacterium]
MNIAISPRAGKPAAIAPLLDVPQLLAAYLDLRPDPALPAQRVVFGTSGHRGSALQRSFNEWHVLAMAQAICDFRVRMVIDGPLYLGFDTHALSQPAFATALEVLAANGVTTLIASGDEFTPTPAISHAILAYNRGRSSHLADGIVITPSHNPPADGGFKYNPPHGGPAGSGVTGWIQDRANALLVGGVAAVRRIPLTRARASTTTHHHDFLGSYVADLAQVIDCEAIRRSGLRIGVDALGGAGVRYWARIAEYHGFDLSVVNTVVDPQFGFMSRDWDGQIRMDPSSPFAMQRLIARKDRYDIAFACDTDYDRHGIVAPSVGLLPSNHYLCVAIDYLFRQRKQWSPQAAVGKSVVSSGVIDRVASRLGRGVREVPVGFKWFVDGLLDGTLGFAGEESAGASFSRIDGAVWTTDKDGIIAGLLAAEITACTGSDPGVLYQALTEAVGEAFADRVEAPADAGQKARLAQLTPQQVQISALAGESIDSVIDHAPGNGAPIGGIKVSTANGWFAARPSGTEALYKIYAESFRSRPHLQAILSEAQTLVDAALEVA